MNKVWVAFTYGEDTTLLGVFSTKALALARIRDEFPKGTEERESMKDVVIFGDWIGQVFSMIVDRATNIDI